MTRHLRSGVFQTVDGSTWAIELRPKVTEGFHAKFIVHAIKTPLEEATIVRRKIVIKPTIIFKPKGRDCSRTEREEFEAFFVDDDKISTKRMFHIREKLFSGSFRQAEEVLMTKCVTLELEFFNETFIEMDYYNFMDSMSPVGVPSRVERRRFRLNDLRDDKVTTIGLHNEGTTCYINSLLQALYSIGSFRDIIYWVDSQ